MKQLNLAARLLRTNQWVKNSVVFVAIIFSGKLFEPATFLTTILACLTFCLLSSGLYIINDILDAPADRRHPVKKQRPIAAGEVTTQLALSISLALIFISLCLALYFSPSLFLLCLLFVGLHIAYSTILKSYAVIDIFAISFSFMIRAFAGEVVSGFHIPVWLRLTLFFMSLFIAAIKRNAELSISGSESRQTLAKYNKHFLDFLTYTFATATIIAYSLYAYNIYDNIEPAPHGYSFLKQIISDFNPGTENRKLMTATIPIVVYAIARYGQLFYTRIEGERPEKIIISDVPLLGAMAIWGAMVIGLIYML